MKMRKTVLAIAMATMALTIMAANPTWQPQVDQCIAQGEFAHQGFYFVVLFSDVVVLLHNIDVLSACRTFSTGYQALYALYLRAGGLDLGLHACVLDV